MAYEKHPHWKGVKDICERLKAQGYVAWLAGGCVRDMLLGIVPHDFDVVTNAVPDVVQKLFPDSLDIGKAFGIIMVPMNDFKVEIATFRSDGNYEDGRRPQSIVFSTPQEDAERRDFTINALFYDPFTGEVKDFVEGQKDLKLKIIKAVGDPAKRFEEDKLRMLRAIRFAAQLDFQIELKTLNAIQPDQISAISAERVYYELSRLMQTPRSHLGFKLLNDSGLLKVILHKQHEANRVELVLERLKKLESASELKKWVLFWQTILVDSESSESKQYLQSLKFSREFIKIFNYVTDALRKIVERKSSKGELYEIVFSAHADVLFEVGSVVLTGTDLASLKQTEELLNDFKELPKALIDGHDLMSLGLKPSSQMKDVLKKAYYYQLENKINDKGSLLNWTKKQIS